MSNKFLRGISLVFLALAAATVLPVAARSYCCTTKEGQYVCADTVPRECSQLPYCERDRGRKNCVAAPLPAEERERKAQEALQAQQEARAKAEDERKLKALMSTYANSKEVEEARDRAVEGLDKLIREAEDKIAVADKTRASLKAEVDALTAARKPVPQELADRLADSESEIAAQQKYIAGRKKDRDDARARFANDLKQMRELESRKPTR